MQERKTRSKLPNALAYQEKSRHMHAILDVWGSPDRRVEHFTRVISRF